MFKLRLIFLFVFVSIIHAQSNSSFTVNEYQFDPNNKNFNNGIRAKAIGDFLFNKKSYSQAVTYYEKALQNISNEADIPFKLAQIYENQKLWKLSILYYQQTITLLKNPINFGKSQLNSYLSQIRIAKIHHLNKQTNETKQIVQQLRQEQSILQSLYPEAWLEFNNYFNQIYPEFPIRVTTSSN
ncbi:MAG: tetratricopeptide repeat protein [Brevinemataceae bacterium]